MTDDVPGDARRLASGLERLGIVVPPEQRETLLRHLGLIRHWSRSFNLVAPGDLPQLVERHLLDSLSIQPWIMTGPVLDVGSGAGFPSVPLAVVNPQIEVWAIDSGGKKVRFLRHVARELELPNLHPVHERVERFSPAVEFSTITCRAFGSLLTFVESVRHLARPETLLLAMKGRAPGKELRALPGDVQAEAVHRLGPDRGSAERHLVVLRIVT